MRYVCTLWPFVVEFLIEIKNAALQSKNAVTRNEFQIVEKQNARLLLYNKSQMKRAQGK